MHSLLNARVHGILDYVTVAAFALAPVALGFGGTAATLSYALAGIHLAMTLVTAFPLGVAALVPFRLHGTVELVVGVALVGIGALAFDDVARGFFVVMGIVILAVWAATDYRAAA